MSWERETISGHSTKNLRFLPPLAYIVCCFPLAAGRLRPLPPVQQTPADSSSLQQTPADSSTIQQTKQPAVLSALLLQDIINMRLLLASVVLLLAVMLANGVPLGASRWGGVPLQEAPGEWEMENI